MENDTIDLNDIIDRILRALVAAKAPPIPSEIASALAGIFCRDAAHYEECHADILAAVNQRVELFLKQSGDLDFSGNR